VRRADLTSIALMVLGAAGGALVVGLVVGGVLGRALMLAAALALGVAVMWLCALAVLWLVSRG
jgi:hypothetical protein